MDCCLHDEVFLWKEIIFKINLQLSVLRTVVLRLPAGVNPPHTSSWLLCSEGLCLFLEGWGGGNPVCAGRELVHSLLMPEHLRPGARLNCHTLQFLMQKIWI